MSFSIVGNSLSDVRAAIEILEVLITGDADAIDEVGDSTCGICYHVEDYLSRYFINECFWSWDKFSGSDSFPIPATLVDCTPDDQYMLDGNKYSGEYGELRRELAKHVLDCIESALEEINDVG